MQLGHVQQLQTSLHTALAQAQNQKVSYRELMVAYAPQQLGYPFNYPNYQTLYHDTILQTLNYQKLRAANDLMDLAEYNFIQLVKAIDDVTKIDDEAQLIRDFNQACLPNEWLTPH